LAIRSRCEEIDVSSLLPSKTVLRVHSSAKLRGLSRSMGKHGLIVPIINNSEYVIVDNNARVEIARRFGWQTITVICFEHLTDEDLRLYAIAANKIPAEATWDLDALPRGFKSIEIATLNIDLPLSGFSIPEIDTMRGTYHAVLLNDLVDNFPALPSGTTVVSQLGDLWQLKSHRLLCGATNPAVIATLMGDA